jgi:hypothetical protein
VAGLCDEALPQSSIYSFLRRERDQLLPDGAFADLFTGRGRCSLPRSVPRSVSDVRAGTLRRWVAGLTPPSVGGGPDEPRLLSFHDLVSLEVVRRFRRSGVSLQKLRKLEVALAESLPGVARPFAQRLFFTDGAAIGADLATGGAEPQIIELVGRGAGHYVWLPVIETFAEEIRFGAENEAVAWKLTDRIEIDPSIQFGEPAVKGTRLPIAVIARELVSHSVEQIADWHAEQDWILVTSDQDFRSWELRVRAYLGRGVDVILCTRQPASLCEQLELIVLNYPRWLEAPAGSARHPQVWPQHRRGGLKVGRT